MTPETLRNIGGWLKSGNTGASSLALCSAALGYYFPPNPWPLDPSDLGRCIAFMEVLRPEEAKQVLLDISKSSRRWDTIRDHWNVLCEMYQSGNADELYKFMKSLGL